MDNTNFVDAKEFSDNVEVMLTTFDNPYDPFDNFIEWLMFDKEMGYNTCEKIARIARSSEEFSTIEDKRETERAIDEIIFYDFLNIYKKLTRKTEENSKTSESEVETTTEEQ